MIAQESKSTDSLWSGKFWASSRNGFAEPSADQLILRALGSTIDTTWHNRDNTTQPFNFQVGSRRVLPIIFTWKALKTTKECWNLVSTISTSTTTITWATNLGLWPLTVIHCCPCERMILRFHTTHLNLFGTNHENEQTARTFRSLLLLPAASGCLICSSVERDTRNCFSYL